MKKQSVEYRVRQEDLLRAEYRGIIEYSKLHLVARKGEPVRTYEDRKNWLGNVKEVCIISETETYQEDMYVTDWTNSRREREKYESMNPISAWIMEDMKCFIEDNIIYFKPYVTLYFKEDCGNDITIPFNKEEEALEYLDSLKEELPMLVVVKE